MSQGHEVFSVVTVEDPVAFWRGWEGAVSRAECEHRVIGA